MPGSAVAGGVARLRHEHTRAVIRGIGLHRVVSRRGLLIGPGCDRGEYRLTIGCIGLVAVGGKERQLRHLAVLVARRGGKIDPRLVEALGWRALVRFFEDPDAAAAPSEAAADQLGEAPAAPEIENPPAVAEGPEAAEAAPDELPPVEELVGHVPPEVRAALEELCRAEWTTVRRLRPTDVKAD